jgi:hypothetical protein
MRIRTVAFALVMVTAVTPFQKMGGQNQGLAPGVIAYLHEDTGLADPTR